MGAGKRRSFAKYGFFEGRIRIANRNVLCAPTEVRRRLAQEAGECVEERQSTRPFDEEELAGFVHLKEQVVPIWSDNKVKAAEDQSKLLEQSDAALLDDLRSLDGFEPELAAGTPPVQPAG